MQSSEVLIVEPVCFLLAGQEVENLHTVLPHDGFKARMTDEIVSVDVDHQSREINLGSIGHT